MSDSNPCGADVSMHYIATLFHIVLYCSIKNFEISVGAAAPTSYNVASPLPRLESLSYLHFKTDGPCIHD